MKKGVKCLDKENEMKTVIVQSQSNGSAVTSLVLGIVGLVIGFIPYIGWFMILVWLLAIIFGLIGMRNKYKRGMAIFGFVLGILGAVYKIGFWFVVVKGLFGVASWETGTVNQNSVTEEKNAVQEERNISDQRDSSKKDTTSEEVVKVKEVTMPNLEGQDSKSIREVLTEKGLVFGKIIEVEDKKIAIGKVVKTEPSEGKVVKEGTDVNVFVSSGVAQELPLQDWNTDKIVDVIGGKKDKIFVFVYYALPKDEGKKDVMDELNKNLHLFTEKGIEVIGIISASTKFKEKEQMRAKNWNIPIYIDKDEVYQKKNSIFFVPDISVQNGAGQIITDKIDGNALFFESISIEDVVNEILDKVKQNANKY